MPLITIFLSLKTVPNIGLAINSTEVFYLIIILSTIILPLCSILLLKNLELVSSLEMTNRKERPLPLLITAISIIFGYYFINDVLIFFPLLLRNEILGAIFLIVAASFISRYWKISLHMLGIGGVVGVLLSLNFLFGNLSNLLIIFVLASGVLGYARLKEKAHSKTQIYTGFIIGVFVEVFCVLFL